MSSVNLCDMCTRKERRLNIRSRWDEELEDLMQYMHDQRYKSDIAKFFHLANEVTSNLTRDTM